MSLSTLCKANRQEGNKNKNRSIVPPIPFEKDPPIKFSKADWREFDIPVQEGSDKTMTVRVPVFERGTCEQYLAWFENVTLVLKGFKIEAPTARLNLMEQLVGLHEGEAKCRKNQDGHRNHQESQQRRSCARQGGAIQLCSSRTYEVSVP